MNNPASGSAAIEAKSGLGARTRARFERIEKLVIEANAMTEGILTKIYGPAAPEKAQAEDEHNPTQCLETLISIRTSRICDALEVLCKRLSGLNENL
jgi:hypothetical protein